MTYTVSALTKVSECETLIANAQKEKSALEYRKTGLERQHDHLTDTSEEVANQLDEVVSRLTQLEAQIPTMAEGQDKKDALYEQAQLVLTRMDLERKQEKKGAIRIIDQEADLERVIHGIATMDEVISQVTARKAELTA